MRDGPPTTDAARSRVVRAGRLVGAMGVLLVGAAQAEVPTGRALVGLQRYDSPQIETDTVNQLYELRWSQRVTDTLTTMLAGRYEDVRGTSSADGVSRGVDVRTLSPSGDLTWQPSPITTAQLGGSLVWRHLRLSQNDHSLDRLYARVQLRPSDLPAVALQAEQRGTHDSTTDSRELDRSVSATVDYQLKKVRLGAGERVGLYENLQLGFSRGSAETQLRANYDDVLLNGRVTVSADVVGSYSRLEERTNRGGVVAAPTQVTVSRASFVTDDTPSDGRDRVPAVLPGLIDGEVAVPTAVALGPDGASFQNLVLDLGRFVEIDELRVHVRAGDGSLVPSGGDVRWVVYVSDDQLTWTIADATGQSTFDQALSRYLVTIRPTTARFVKLVSEGTNVLPEYASEVQVFFHSLISADTTRASSVALGSARLSVSAKPMNEVTLLYIGLANAFGQFTNAGSTPSFDSDQSLMVIVEPFKVLVLGARYQDRRVASAGLVQRYDGAEGNIGFVFHKNARATVTALSQFEDTGGRVSTTNGARVSSVLRVLPKVLVNAEGGYQRQLWAAEGRFVDRLYANGMADGQVTRALRLMLQATVGRNRYTGGTDDTVAILPSRDDRYSAEVSYRASPQFAFAARFGYASGDAVSGLIQRYRIDWLPFPEGSFRFAGAYDQDVDPALGRTVQRVTVTPHWAVNRHAAFDLNYTLAASDGPTPIRTTNFFVTFTLTL